jgi:choline dehydrogenase-like flavoprotein
MQYDGDVIVIGSGAGGATFAYACAKAGKSVLLLERGRRYRPDEHPLDEKAMLIDKRPYDDRSIDVNGTPKQLYIGGVLGGGTALYGAALVRPSRDDFHPGKHYGERLPAPLWDWPIDYDELEPHYTEAERLLGVAGAGEDDFGPLQKPRHGYSQPPLPLHPLNERLMAGNRAHGLRPFRLPLAIDPARCLRCHACAGYICPTGARRGASHLVEHAEGLAIRVLTGVEAESLTHDGAGRIDGVRAVDRSSGEKTVYHARRYVLAAGAIGSPLVLLRSGVDGPHVGRHYMAHLSPLAVGFFPRRTGADETFVKQLGFADYYFGTAQHRHKLGLVQSLPVPGPLMTAKTAPKFIPRRLQQFLRRRMLPLAGIVEDLPDPANRVSWGNDGRPALRHRFSPYDHERGRQLGRLMTRILRRAGALFCMVKAFPSDEHMAHQCGTVRFGADPAHAALGADCRLFGQDNVFVVDGSFMPTSLGVGPALTIAANALRVAGIVNREV